MVTILIYIQSLPIDYYTGYDIGLTRIQVLYGLGKQLFSTNYRSMDTIALLNDSMIDILLYYSDILNNSN